MNFRKSLEGIRLEGKRKERPQSARTSACSRAGQGQITVGTGPVCSNTVHRYLPNSFPSQRMLTF